MGHQWVIHVIYWCIWRCVRLYAWENRSQSQSVNMEWVRRLLKSAWRWLIIRYYEDVVAHCICYEE